MNRRSKLITAHRPKHELMPGFRIIHCFAWEINMQRLERHMRRLVKEFTRAGELAKVKRRSRLGWRKPQAQ
jgi:hypothetical protein